MDRPKIGDIKLKKTIMKKESRKNILTEKSANINVDNKKK